MIQYRYETICQIRNATRKTIYHASKAERIEKVLAHTPENILQSKTAIEDMDEIVSRTRNAVKRMREEYWLVYRDLCLLERAYDAWKPGEPQRSSGPSCRDLADHS